MPYIHFTDEQKLRANSVDLERFLESRGETLLPSGPEKRLKSNHSITVRGSEWYDHAQGVKTGGGPVAFVMYHYGLKYPEAMTLLLGGEQGVEYRPAPPKEKQDEPRPFALPDENPDMRRVYGYLLKKRLISPEVLGAFVNAGLIYESLEVSKDQTRTYRNAVFVGFDEHGVARHAHKRALGDAGGRWNVESSAPQYSFHWQGAGDRLYVFEAPIDLLSFLTLYQKNWQDHSYVALCGTSEHAMLWMLEQNPSVQNVVLCLDHDEAGIEATGQHLDTLRERGYRGMVLQPQYKDWNEDLKACRGFPAQSAEEHPEVTAASTVCERIMAGLPAADGDQAGRQLPVLLEKYRSHSQGKRFTDAAACMEAAAALALAAVQREYRQMGQELPTQQIAEELRRRTRPHLNRSALTGRASEIDAELRNVLTRSAGVHTETEKKQTASAWLDLASSCAKVSIKHGAEQIKQQQEEAPVRLETAGLVMQ